MNVDEHAREVEGISGHGFLSHIEPYGVARDEGVDYVELLARLSVHFDNFAVLDTQAGAGIGWCAEYDKAGVGPRLDERVFIDFASGAHGEAAGLTHRESSTYHLRLESGKRRGFIAEANYSPAALRR
jgi:hypothetical protein